MTMPRSVEDILKHADELAKRFEDYQPKAEDERDPDAVNMRDRRSRRVRMRNGRFSTLWVTPAKPACRGP